MAEERPARAGGWVRRSARAVAVGIVGTIAAAGYYAFMVAAMLLEWWHPTSERRASTPVPPHPVPPRPTHRRLDPIGVPRSFSWGCLSSGVASAVAAAEVGSVWERQDVVGPDRFYRVLERSSCRPDPCGPYEARVTLQPMREVDAPDATSDWRACGEARRVPRELSF